MFSSETAMDAPLTEVALPKPPVTFGGFFQ